MQNVPTGVEYLPLLLPLVTIGISIPLLLRKVPPNVLYGFRTRKTLSDRAVWYEANYRGAVDLIVASLAGLLCWAVAMMALDRARATFVGLAVTVAAMLVAILVWLVQLKNL
ncbi:MAG: SdpI family protein [Terriglobales bacterium]